MRYNWCFCCKSSASVDLNSTSNTEIPEIPSESPTPHNISTITYISESPKLSEGTRSRTMSVNSMKSIKSFYSARSTNSNPEDFYSMGSGESVESFQSVPITTKSDENIRLEEVK